ncbi:MAG: M14 family zinc carboxypeptidase [Kofleriaceae bacterium]
MSKVGRALLVLVTSCVAAPKPTGVVPPSTAEKTHFERTGRYAEAVEECHAFAKAYAGVECREIGRTAEDRPIVALDIGDHKLPVVYIEGGIHAGEIEGKDAGFQILRDVLDQKVVGDLFTHVRVIFVPVINPDGHERFGANNRPNQRGPVEMGFRTNAERLNINRDWMKVQSNEAAAAIGVLAEVEPRVFVDLHTTDGAKFEHDIAINALPLAPRSDHLEQAAQQLSAQLTERMTQLGHLPIDTFYPSFVKVDDPSSGFAVGEAPPRFSQAYVALRDTIGILIETHSWKTYPQRVKATYDVLLALFERMRTPISKGVMSAGNDSIAGQDLVVESENTDHVKQLAFRGYEYKQVDSDISGAKWTIYDETKPQIWNIPLRDELKPKTTVHVPRQGYVIEGGYALSVAALLDRHHIKWEPRSGSYSVKVFRATKVTWSPQTFEGEPRVKLEGEWTEEKRVLDRGAIFVPIHQPHQRLIVHLLDPAAPDSLAQWGMFDTAFEQKEYMEEYVVEEQARALIAKQPALKAEFDKALAADPELAKSPEKRLNWWYRKTAAYDERLNLLPVYQDDSPDRPGKRTFNSEPVSHVQVDTDYLLAHADELEDGRRDSELLRWEACIRRGSWCF